MRSNVWRSRAAAVAVFLLPASAAAQSIPPDSAVRAVIKPRVDTGRYAGIAVGFITRDGRQQITAYGPNAGVTPFDANTVFEIGSITKTFTTAILADMVAKKEVALDDPVAKHLPPGTKVPERDGRQITLLDLATQIVKPWSAVLLFEASAHRPSISVETMLWAKSLAIRSTAGFSSLKNDCGSSES